ncbi:NAD-dependent deacetylase hst3 [Sporothrix epigloea]|uniref:NAD-dependent deacetylase hst3 n=1 Tax=Sporothrix epigloea TaxID=1892477 RepID=A0ABP0DEG1_9PEZI
MPTSQVLPGSAELLQEIADALWKAKKVVVVTGAGISTNSGIPDFRSKNGLYSMIQAQFEAVSASKDEQDKQDEQYEQGTEGKGNENDDSITTKPASKRRKIAPGDEQAGRVIIEQNATAHCIQNTKSPTKRRDRRGRTSKRTSTACEEGDTIYCAHRDFADNRESIVVQLPALDPKKFAQPLMTPDRVGSRHADSFRQSTATLPLSSSPLSSPPPFLFDPMDERQFDSTNLSSSNSSAAQSPICSSDADSDYEDATIAKSTMQPSLSTQSSFTSNKSALPFIKGRDLFDASIWADPIKTSVFYTFATTLRQKVRDVVPTRSHEFISHLRDTNKLVRCYTQNIDEIEEKVGLSTSLFLGPGKRGRFSARSSATRASLSLGPGKSGKVESCQESQAFPLELASSQESQSSTSSENLSASQSLQSQPQPGLKNLARNHDPCHRGVDCVFLHGSLRLLRCFRCGQTTPWDEAGLEDETMSGRQPSCPRCAGATAAREGRGKRALAVGKLRPDIVLYGEDHPNAHLISPIVQHDLSLTPDMLLILGTSLKVHGLKVLVREFAKAVHSRCGKVVFVNFTKPPESVWSDVIDYWVQWDCDTWVEDLKQKKPIMWLPPGSVTGDPKKKRTSLSAGVSAKGNKRDSDGVEAGEKCEPPCTVTADRSADSAGGGAGEDQKPRRRQGRPPKLKSENGKTEGENDSQNEAGKRVTETPALPSATSRVTPTDWKRESARKAKTGAPGEKKKRNRKRNDAIQPAVTRVGRADSEIEVWKTEQQSASFTGRTLLDKMSSATASVHFRASDAEATKRRPKEPHLAPGKLEIALSSLPRTDNPAASPPILRSCLPSLRRFEAMPLSEIPTNILPYTATALRPGQDKYSIRSAVKANPQVRQPKKIFESGGGPTGGPLLASAQSAAPLKRHNALKLTPTLRTSAPQVGQQRQELRHHTQESERRLRKGEKAPLLSKSVAASLSLEPVKDMSRPPAPQLSLAGASVGAGWSSIDRMAEQLKMSMKASWSDHVMSESVTPTQAAIAREPTITKVATAHRLPLQEAATAFTAPRSSLPPIREIFPDFLPMSRDTAFFHQDPLGTCYSYPPPWPREPQEWSCTNQVEREADEQLLAAAVERHSRSSRRPI